jgi:hypothetical protein
MEHPADESPREQAARYLELLRAEHSHHEPATGPPSGVASTPAFHDEPTPAQPERRRYARYTCAGSAELRKEWSSVGTWGTFTDISLGGCYVEMQATFPPETRMDLTLELDGIRVCSKAVVRVTYPFLGMGLAFTEMSQEDDARLHRMISRLTGPSRTIVGATRIELSKSAANIGLPIMMDPVAAIDVLARHFETHAQLTRETFLDLIRKSQAISTRE